jgi:hypothetical protein
MTHTRAIATNLNAPIFGPSLKGNPTISPLLELVDVENDIQKENDRPTGLTEWHSVCTRAKAKIGRCI